VGILRLFGAKIGRDVRIKPFVHIKYPWRLTLGDHSWLADCYIENLAPVIIAKNVCVSQQAMLLTGNHNFKLSTFDLMVNGITLEDGVWIGAKATVCPGVTCKSHSVLAVGSVATKDLDSYSIYQGNPAMKVKDRVIEMGANNTISQDRGSLWYLLLIPVVSSYESLPTRPAILMRYALILFR
jgi:putative colanic acid biosynthesis acetyltransferase WcaF